MSPLTTQPAEQTSGETHLVQCHSCQAPFDANTAPWCSCITSEHTFVCPSCGECFCKSPAAYKRSFWRDAPKSLRERSAHMMSGSAVPVAAKPEEGAGPALVLLVEDDPVTRRAATIAIRKLGYELVVASDGEQGLELAQRLHPAVVLTDALMPKIDGREMCRLIKESPACAGVRVFVMTALYTGTRYQNEAHKTFKVDGYLAKPVAFDDVRTLLAKALPSPAAAQPAAI